MRTIITALALALAATGAATHVSAEAPSGYKLVWADEFDQGAAPDKRKWAYDTIRNKDGWWNNEAQYYSDDRRENARLEGGKLIIEARKEELPQLADWGGQKYTSARLITKGKAEWTHGFFETRAKLPCGVGQWPAIWLLGTGQWPDAGEIDIMEAVGFEPTVIYANVHTRYSVDNKMAQGGQVVLMDYCAEFHDYQVEWTPKALIFSIDGKPFYRFDKPSDDKTKWPFDGAHYMILNVAIGGAWGGQKGIDDTKFPARMEVEYVRVYQKP